MILRALCLRPLLARPARTLATVAGVAVGVAAVLSTLAASRAAVASLGSDVEVIAGRARLEVTRPGGVAVADVARLRPFCGEVLVAPVVEGVALAPALGDLVRVLGVDLLVDGDVRELALETAGPDPDAARGQLLSAEAVALPRALAEALGAQAGGAVELVVRARTVSLAVAEVFEPPRFAAAWDRIVLADVALAQELLGRLGPDGGRYDRVELVPRLPLDADALAARLTAALPAGYRVAPASARRAEGERLVRALDFNLTALAGVSVLVGVVLVATALATSVVQRRLSIALLRSLGASRAQLAGAVLLEAAVIGLLGGGAGILLGEAGARAALASVHATVTTVARGAVAGEVRLTGLQALSGLALGVASALVAALLPLREALRTPPVQGLAGENPESVARRPWHARALVLALLVAGAFLAARVPPQGDRPFGALGAALFLLATLLVLAAPLIDLFAALRPRFLGVAAATPLRIAQAALEAGRRRAAWAAGAVGVAVALAVAMTAMVGSFRESVVAWTEQSLRADLFLRPLPTDGGTATGGLAPEVVALVEDVAGAANVDPFHESVATVAGQRVALAGAAFSVGAREGGVPFLDGRPSADVFRQALERRGAVVNEPFARRFDVGPGDMVELATPGGTVRRTVAGVYRDYSGHTGRVVLDLADFLTLYPDEGPQNVAVFVPADRDVARVRSALAEALAGRFAVEILQNRELRDEVLVVFERTFAVTVALQLMASLVACIAVVTVLSALVHERRRELSLVRVLGASRAQLAGVVVGEALLLGLAGALGGLAVGLAVGWVLVAIVNVQSFGWTLAFAPPPALLWTVAAVLPACLVASLVPALVALRSAPQEALRELA